MITTYLLTGQIMARRILIVEDGSSNSRNGLRFVLRTKQLSAGQAEDYDSAVNQLNEYGRIYNSPLTGCCYWRLRYPVHQTPPARVDDQDIQW